MIILKYVFGLILVASVYSIVLMDKGISGQEYFLLVLGVLSAAGLYHYNTRNSQQTISKPDDPPAIRQQTVNPQASGAAAAAAQLNNGGLP